MSTRTPPSLKWLINKRSRLDGKIQRAQRVLEEADRLAKELPKLRADLEAIDRTLRIHEIPVEPENIQAISEPGYRVPLQHGELTRTLLALLRSQAGSPLSTFELTSLLIERFPCLQDKTQSLIELKNLQSSVRHRLKRLAAENIITRLPARPGSKIKSWTITI